MKLLLTLVSSLTSSGSLRKDYGKEKNFLKVLTATFGISPSGSRAGVITFSYYTEHSIKLKDHTDLLGFNKAVDKIPVMGSTTRIDKALRLAPAGNGSVFQMVPDLVFPRCSSC